MCRGNPYCNNEGRQAGCQGPSFLLIPTSERKLLFSFMSSQKGPTPHQGPALDKCNSPLAESTASGGRASTSTSSSSSMPWKHRGFHLGIACSTSLHQALCLCLLSCQKPQTVFYSEIRLFLSEGQLRWWGKQLNIWARFSVSDN